MFALRRTLLVPLTALLLTSGGGAPMNPIAQLTSDGQVSSARFETAHATYSAWRVRWARPAADLQLVFASNARTAAEAGQLRELTVTAFAPSARFTPAQRAALRAAARDVARLCGLPQPMGAPVTGQGEPGTTQAAQLSLTVTLPDGRAPVCVVPVR